MNDFNDLNLEDIQTGGSPLSTTDIGLISKEVYYLIQASVLNLIKSEIKKELDAISETFSATTVRTVFNVGSGEESYPKLKVQSYKKQRLCNG